MKEEILKLRAEGKTYLEIVEIVGCSKATVSYHCSKGRKEKQLTYNKNKFKWRSLTTKLWDFKHNQGKNKSPKKNFSIHDILEKFGAKPKCALTGEQVDLKNGGSFSLDHKIPVAQGGDNEFDNLQITTQQANYAKRDLTNEQFIDLCVKVLTHHGYKVNQFF